MNSFATENATKQHFAASGTTNMTLPAPLVFCMGRINSPLA
jgi:hypothetical protein